MFCIPTQAVKQLVENGANINARCKESKNHTALHEAVIGGHKEVAQYLLQMGANQVRGADATGVPVFRPCTLTLSRHMVCCCCSC